MTVDEANAPATNAAPPSTAAVAAQATSALSPSSRQAAANVWASAFFDTLTKYERNSERQLYIYGITTLRCVGCRHRLKPGAAACDNCQQPVDDKTKSCTRCSVRIPALWCHECDAYFCEPCHNKPHVLVLGGKSPPRHHCFPIDTCSGKTLRRGAWSTKILAKCKAVRREQWRLQKEKDAAAKQAAATTESTPAANPAASAPPTVHSAETVRPPEHSSRENDQHETKKHAPATLASTVEQIPNPPRSQSVPTNGAVPASRSVTPTPVVPTPAEQQAPSQPSATAAPVPAKTATPNRSGASVSRPTAPSPSPKASTPSALETAPSSATLMPPGLMPIAQPSFQAPAASSRSTTAITPPASRKRKAPATETAPPAPARSMPPPRQQPAATTEPSASAVPPAVTTSTSAPAASTTAPPRPTASAPAPPRPTSGGSLYDRLRQMHDLQRRQQAAAQAMRVKPEPAPPTTAAPPAPPAPPAAPAPSPPSAPENTVTVSTTTSNSTFEPPTTAAKAETPRRAPSPAPGDAPAPAPSPQDNMTSSTGDSDLERALSQTIDPPPAPVVDLTARPPTPPTGAAPAIVGAGADDPLKVAVIEEYEKTNEYVLKLEAQIAYISDAVRRASMQNVAMAAQISDRVNAYRRMLAEATERRCRALAKVVLFSPDVRASARQMDRDELADLPPVLTACHNKCGQLAIAVKQHRERLQELRAAIDSAIASGDATQIAQLQTLGTQIQEVESQIRQAKSDRDAQFKLMVRFSKKVRDMVQLEAQALKP